MRLVMASALLAVAGCVGNTIAVMEAEDAGEGTDDEGDPAGLGDLEVQCREWGSVVTPRWAHIIDPDVLTAPPAYPEEHLHLAVDAWGGVAVGNAARLVMLDRDGEQLHVHRTWHDLAGVAPSSEVGTYLAVWVAQDTVFLTRIADDGSSVTTWEREIDGLVDVVDRSFGVVDGEPTVLVRAREGDTRYVHRLGPGLETELSVFLELAGFGVSAANGPDGALYLADFIYSSSGFRHRLSQLDASGTFGWTSEGDPSSVGDTYLRTQIELSDAIYVLGQPIHAAPQSPLGVHDLATGSLLRSALLPSAALVASPCGGAFAVSVDVDDGSLALYVIDREGVAEEPVALERGVELPTGYTVEAELQVALAPTGALVVAMTLFASNDLPSIVALASY